MTLNKKTFSHIICMNSLQALLSLVLNKGRFLNNLDAYNAFLFGNEEQVGLYEAIIKVCSS